jgi:hypothetical protein
MVPSSTYPARHIPSDPWRTVTVVSVSVLPMNRTLDDLGRLRKRQINATVD